MKNIIFLLALSALFVSSCSKGDSGAPVKEQMISFKAQAPALKTVIARDDTTTYWSEYDDIAVYLFNGGSSVMTDVAEIDFTSVSLKSATFYPRTSKTFQSWKSMSGNDSKVYALAPSSQVVPAQGYSVNVTVPSEQTGDFGRHQILCASGASLSHVVNMSFVPATALFSIRLNLTPESKGEACNVTKLELTFNGGKVTGDNVLDLQSSVLKNEGSGNKVVITLPEPVKVVMAPAEGIYNHFNDYITCALIPSASVTSVSVAVYDNQNNKFTSSVDLQSSVLKAGSNHRCDCFFYMDKVVTNDSVEAEGDESFAPDWEIEL